MTRTTHLKAHPSCQCKINIDGNRIDFISYTTRVISIIVENGKRLIECTGTYSRTTAKQITYFLREYAPDLCLEDMKKIQGGRVCGLLKIIQKKYINIIRGKFDKKPLMSL